MLLAQLLVYPRCRPPVRGAVGDVCLKHQFTHMAGETGLMVCANALFDGDEKYSSRVVPWVTYTKPEVAHVGAYERDLEGDDFQAGAVP